MSSARRPRSRSRQPRNALRARTQPPMPRLGEGDQPYTASSGNYSSGTQYEVSPVERHGTPGAFFPGSSQLSESDYRATPPPVAPMRATDTKGIGRGGRGGKPASSASPATGKSKRVRTGCLTCRERHLKCDEGVPECNNCRKSNRECRRGIRLNFIDIQVKDPPYLPPTTEWSVQILDESRLIAAEYRGGLGRYPEVVSSTPEPDLDASRREPERSDAQTVSHFLSATSGGGDTSVIRDQYHPQHVGQPPPRGPPSHHGSPPARPGLESSSLDARSAPRPQLGPGGFGEDAFSFASLHDPDGVKGLKSHTLNIRNRDGLTIGPPNEFRSAAQASSSRQIGTPTGLMTPSSENTTGERDYLSTAEEIHFMQVFIDEVSIWMDALNKDKHFANTVPYLALKLPMLLNALLACGARHLTLTGQHSGEKADYYYNMATTQLLSQQTRDRNSSENALTAVVLTAYNVMTDRPNDRMGHIASTRALIRECGWNASSTGLAVACFWVNVGMEVLSCISFGWQTAWDPDQWGLDLEFATLGAASRSGSRSVAGSDDVWSVRAEGHPVANDSLETADEEELYLHRIFYIMAKVANFRANTPQFQEPSPHDEQVRLQNRFAEWRRLQNMCNAWNLNCPRSMRPYGYLPEPSSKSLFPNVWLIKPPSKLARLFYHTAMCLLAQLNPLEPRSSSSGNTNTSTSTTSGGANRDSQLLHAHHVCGIVAHTRDRGVVSVAIRSLAVVSAALADPREQDEVLAVLERIGKETGWRLGRVVGELRVAWGRVEGGGSSSFGAGAGAGLGVGVGGGGGGAGMGVLAPLSAAGNGVGGLRRGDGEGPRRGFSDWG